MKQITYRCNRSRFRTLFNSSTGVTFSPAMVSVLSSAGMGDACFVEGKAAGVGARAGEVTVEDDVCCDGMFIACAIGCSDPFFSIKQVRSALVVSGDTVDL